MCCCISVTIKQDTALCVGPWLIEFASSIRVSGPTCYLQVVDLDSRLLVCMKSHWRHFCLFFFKDCMRLPYKSQQRAYSFTLFGQIKLWFRTQSLLHPQEIMNQYSRPASSSEWNTSSHLNLEPFPLSCSCRPAWRRYSTMLCALCWINFTFSCFSFLLLMRSCPTQLKVVLK